MPHKSPGWELFFMLSVDLIIGAVSCELAEKSNLKTLI